MTSAEPTSPEEARRVARAITWLRLPIYGVGLWLACGLGHSSWHYHWQHATCLILVAAILALETLALHYPDHEDKRLRRVALACVLVVLPGMFPGMLLTGLRAPDTDSIIELHSPPPLCYCAQPIDWLLVAACAGTAAALVPRRVLHWLLPVWTLVTLTLPLVLWLLSVALGG